MKKQRRLEKIIIIGGISGFFFGAFLMLSFLLILLLTTERLQLSFIITMISLLGILSLIIWQFVLTINRTITSKFKTMLAYFIPFAVMATLFGVIFFTVDGFTWLFLSLIANTYVGP